MLDEAASWLWLCPTVLVNASHRKSRSFRTACASADHLSVLLFRAPRTGRIPAPKDQMIQSGLPTFGLWMA